MDISSVGGSAMTPEVQAQYAVKCMQMSQQTSYIAGDLIQDTAEISAEALQNVQKNLMQVLKDYYKINFKIKKAVCSNRLLFYCPTG